MECPLKGYSCGHADPTECFHLKNESVESHYYIGGDISNQKFHMLCGKVEHKYNEATMKAGWLGAREVTCPDCIAELETKKEGISRSLHSLS